MIKSFKLNKKQCLHDYESDIKFLSKKINFKPGLNIVFGPNGSGKSTLLKIIARQHFALRSGKPVLTTSDISNLSKSKELAHTGLVEHDGQPLIFVDPRVDVGLISGAFDDEFFGDGVRTIMQKKSSTGQYTSMRINEALKMIMESPESFPAEIERRVSVNEVNNLWKDRFLQAEKMLEPSIPVGQKTILMDEPESGLSLLWQSGLWKNVFESEQAKKFQIIVATHSPFALGIKHAHYIETEHGYVDQCVEQFTNFGEWLKLGI